MMKIVDNTSAVLREVDRRIAKNLKLSISVVKDKAIATVAVKTGATQQSIDSKVDGHKAVVGAGTEYAPHLETRKPFLRPALHGSLNFIRKVFKAK